MTEPVCVISGVGPGTGSALARRFTRGGYRVAMLARNRQRLNEIERELPESKAYACDVSDAAQVEATADEIERELGVPTALVHNAVGGPSAHSWKSIQRCLAAIFKPTRWDCFTWPVASRRQ
jgi:NAD(P)-dependent dehydrogenase (short-subunit alcohol dehydrogenase family)